MANTSPAKISVECPHCGFKQAEYAAAKSSICRQCGRYFPNRHRNPASRSGQRRSAPPENPSILHRFEDFWKRRGSSVVECFECKRKQQVCGTATSTICPGCSAHIDLRDYKITSGFSRSIRTRGDVHLTAKGDLSSSSVICRSALVEGRLRGNLHCDDTATINFSGKIPGRLSGRHVIVDRKADIHCFRQVRVGSIEIKGKMSGEIIAQMVTVHKKGPLEGNVTARAISVEKGGMFSGELVIGQADLTQGELLPGQKSTAASKRALIFRKRHPNLCRRLNEFQCKDCIRAVLRKTRRYVHLPRLIDKARLHRKGLLNGYNYKTVGFDKHLLAFLKIDGDAFEEIANKLDDDRAILNWVRENAVKHSPDAIEQWNQAMISRHPDTAAKKARFLHFLKGTGGEGRKDIRTYFDLIEFDEGRLK